MSRRPTRHFEVIKTKLPPRTRRSIAGGRCPSGPEPRNNRDREPAVELDEAVRQEPEPLLRDPKRSGPGVTRNDQPSIGSRRMRIR